MREQAEEGRPPRMTADGATGSGQGARRVEPAIRIMAPREG